MSIAEKLQTIAENEPKVYDAGKKAEYDSFWDVYQQNGNRRYYHSAFSRQWNDDCYNPKYPIICGDGEYDAYSIFQGAEITDTKVDIYAPGYASSMFYTCSNLKTIRKLIVTEKTEYGSMFYQAYAVENIVYEGVIANNLSMAACSKLSKASIESVINALSTTTTGKTLSLSKTAIQSAFGTNYDSSTEWTTLKNSKSNWTITLS